jgi:hypothetical protein
MVREGVSYTLNLPSLTVCNVYAGEIEQEPEVDLSGFLEKQRLSADDTFVQPEDENDDVDESLAHISSRNHQPNTKPKKGQVQQIDWDENMDEMSREKAAAEASRGQCIFRCIFSNFIIFIHLLL